MVFSLFTENAKNAENNEYAERMAANPGLQIVFRVWRAKGGFCALGLSLACLNERRIPTSHLPCAAFYSEISDRINAYFDDQERGEYRLAMPCRRCHLSNHDWDH